jgi:hypothetical protein
MVLKKSSQTRTRQMSDNGQHEEAGAPGEGKTRIVVSFPRASEQSPRYQTLLVVLVQE